ncbi:hypothetical protein SDC9_174430 [bioreactor metagenome]|uniref:Uncharacterized protein n=1 Tax=bioreactor metagenome TaxID=1076179 RepID=A0A645GTP7_9ZZZZ
MDDAQHVVAVAHVVHDHPEGKQVKNFIQRFILIEHFAVDGVGMLHPAIDLVVNVHLIQAQVDLFLSALHEIVVLRSLCVKLGDNFIKSHRVQIF